MVTVCLALAWLMAAAHLTLIAIVIFGGSISLRWPSFLPVHAIVAIAVVTVFALGADCPLTTWQKYFLRRAGHVPYNGGFIEHYLMHPVTGGGMTTSVKILVLATWLTPTVVSYALLSQRRSGRSGRLSA